MGRVRVGAIGRSRGLLCSVLAVVLTACAGAEEPTTVTPPGSDPTTTTQVSTTLPATSQPPTTPPSTSRPPITVTPPTTSTTKPPDTVVPSTGPPVTVMPPTTKPPTGAIDLPWLVIADGEGVRLVDDGRVVASFVRNEAVSLAVPDLSGGVVYQRPLRDPTGLEWSDALARNVFVWGDGPPEPIRRVRAAGAEAEVIVEHPDAKLTLVDVVRLDDRPVALYRMYIGGPQQEPVWDIVFDWLCVHDLETGADRCLGLIGSYESSYVEMRCGGDVVVVSFDAYGESPGTTIGIAPISVLDEDVEKDWLPSLVYDTLRHGPGTECVAPAWCQAWAVAAVASDGSRASWVQGGVEWDATGEATTRPIEVVLLDPATGREVSRIVLGDSEPLPRDGERATFIDDDGAFVVVSGVGVGGPALLVAPDESIVTVAEPGAVVSFWE